MLVDPFLYFFFIFFIFFFFAVFVMEKDAKTIKSQFWPANGMQSQSTFVVYFSHGRKWTKQFENE